MKTYQRLFGSGPRGALLSLVLLGLAWYLDARIGLPVVISSAGVRLFLCGLLSAAGLGIIAWSLHVLPPAARGRKLVTAGPFRYFRHPLYAAFLVYFNPAFALWMNNWIYLAWAALLYPLWSLNVRGEERLMREEFGEAYIRYCQNSGRFLPRFDRSLTR